MFLWIVIILMAVALVAEIIALIGIAVTASRATRHAILLRDEFAARLKSATGTAREIADSVRPEVEKIRRNGAEIATTVHAAFLPIREAWQDLSGRAQRLRLRFSREGVATLGRLQSDKRVVSRGVLKRMRTAASVALGVRATTWLLRRVA